MGNVALGSPVSDTMNCFVPAPPVPVVKLSARTGARLSLIFPPKYARAGCPAAFVNGTGSTGPAGAELVPGTGSIRVKFVPSVAYLAKLPVLLKKLK